MNPETVTITIGERTIKGVFRTWESDFSGWGPSLVRFSVEMVTSYEEFTRFNAATVKPKKRRKL